MVDSIVFKIFFVILSYLIGSVCFGYVFAKILKKKDFGKKDLPGAAGTFRQYGYKVGILTGFLDALKGAVPPLLAKFLGLDDMLVVALACIAVIVGHNWPVFFKFRGGGGLAPTLGVSAVLIPIEFAIAFPSAVALGFIYRYTLRKRLKFHPNVVGGGFGVLLLPILAFIYKEPWPVIAAFAIIFIIIAVKGPILSKIYTDNR
jgi:acyl-phosphate glycerol 3-phosphate acyltransferase